MTKTIATIRRSIRWAKPTCAQIVRPMGQHEAIEDKGNPAFTPL